MDILEFLLSNKELSDVTPEKRQELKDFFNFHKLSIEESKERARVLAYEILMWQGDADGGVSSNFNMENLK